jgi:alpha-L-rhamnosidase/F5/8 type C domain/Glycosyl hydrolases family 2, sugar binding domain
MKKISLILLMLIWVIKSQAQTLQQDFQTPPNAAKPRVWWHWMNGNITKAGIQKDLDWMQRIGIGGFQNFDASLFTPVIVPKKVVFMTPEWKDAFRFTTELADKKGLEMAIAGSPGWSVTGGPWVEPKDAMKKYVWTETRIEGGKTFSGKLLKPSDATGKFQNAKIESGGIMGGFVGVIPSFYQDAAVIAYRLPQSDKSMVELNPKVTSSGGTFTLKELTDGDLMNVQMLPPKKAGEEMWIQYEFETPQTIKAFSVAGANHVGLEDFYGGPENRSLQASDDGITFKQIATVSGSIVPENTVSFPATTAKYFRLVYKTLESQPNMIAIMAGMKPEPPKPMGVEVSEFVLHTTDRIDRLEDKAGFTPWKEDTKTFLAPNVDAISTNEVVDITSKMNADGTLNWEVPKGNWVIVRMGYSLTGRQNHPASPEATGLEVDKLDKEAVRKYINTYLDMYKDATGGLMGEKGLTHMILDSYEAGHMTWTKTFPEEFQKRRGYSMMSWIPVLTGRVVQSVESSEKFLWDFRKTIGELIANNHYDVIGEELHKRGMKRYTESHEDKRIYLADGMDVKRNAEIPMSAMWTPGSLAGGNDEEVRSEGDIREAASVANIYGQNIVAAESMTSIQNAFSWHPEKLKRTADLEMASGLNRFVIHTSVHQPLDDKMPGFSLGPFGQYFTRQETWAETGGKAWMEYLGRSCHLLQQGKNVADILYYYGENTNITWLCRQKLPTIPAGHEFDFVNATALLENIIQAKNGKILAKSGNTYNVLMLDETAKYMTLPVLKKIKSWVDAGIKVIGMKPEKSPSLADNDDEFQKLANEVWTNANVTTFDKINIQPDVQITKTNNKILFRHRKSESVDIYWLDNRSENPTNAEISFKVAGKTPELWNPMNGKIEKVTFQIKDGRTIIPLKFESWDAFFVVFKETAKSDNFTKIKKAEKEIITLKNPWQINFQTERSAPANVTFTELKSFTENTDSGIKYFSGTASYKSTFMAPKNPKGEYVIDLGEVKNVAEVLVNGKSVGTVWKKPFKVELGNALKAGENSIEIKVTNLWVNRLIGDAQPETKNKITFTTMPFYQANSPLLPSGLLGPVRILVKE